MNKRKATIWAIGGIGLLIAGLFGGMSLFGLLPWQGGELYEDPQGRFTMQIDPSWEQVDTDGRYTQFKVADPPLNMYLLVLEAGTIDEAFSRSFEFLGFDPGLLIGGDRAIFGDWEAYSKEDAAGISHALAGQIVGENTYVLMVKAEKPGVSPENAAVMRVMNSLKIVGKEEFVIESFADLEAMVQKKVDSLAGSVSVAVMQEGQIIYTYAYGLANPVEDIPALPPAR
jgi:hypothetical protein